MTKKMISCAQLPSGVCIFVFPTRARRNVGLSVFYPMGNRGCFPANREGNRRSEYNLLFLLLLAVIGY